MSRNDSTERKMIEQTLDDYFQGMHHSRRDLIEKCFHENGSVCGFDTVFGERMDMDRTGFAAFVASQPSPADNGEAFDMTIKSLEMKGRIAMVYVDDLYLGKRFTDYLLLVKDGDTWTILNKVWHADPA